VAIFLSMERANFALRTPLAGPGAGARPLQLYVLQWTWPQRVLSPIPVRMPVALRGLHAEDEAADRARRYERVAAAYLTVSRHALGPIIH